MNWLDVILIIAIVLFMIRGTVKGLFQEAFGVGGIFLGIVVAINRYEAVGEIISRELDKFATFSPRIVSLISFVIIFIAVALLCNLAGMLLHKASRYSPAKGLDQGGGFLLGLFEGSLVCSIILILLNVSPLSERASVWMRGSALSPYLLKEAPAVYDSVIFLIPGKARKLMEKLDKFKELIPGDKGS